MKRFRIIIELTVLLCAFLFIFGCACSKKVEEQVQSGDVVLGSLDEMLIRGSDAITEPTNILVNSGFEQAMNGWKWLDWSKGWSAYEHDTQHAYEGKGSVHFPVRSDARQTIVWGVVQEPTLTEDIPECIEGYYYVDSWDSGAWKQYMQLVVIDLSHSLGENQGQAQLRYIISGTTTPPLSISNAQYLFAEKVRRERPVLKKWTKFSVNPRADFENSWQYTPTAGAKLRVLFEARYDGHRGDQAPASADVYFDNLYMGPKTATRCADKH